jgi:excisionase family DNA binding protein
MTGKPSHFYTKKEVAARFGVAEDTVAKWAYLRKIPAIKTFGGHYRFPKKQIDELLASRSETTIQVQDYRSASGF